MASVSRTRRMISGAKLGTPTKFELLALGQRIADAQAAVIGDADHVARKGLVRNGAVLGKEEMRRMDADRFAGANASAFMPRVSLPEHSRAKAMRSRWFGSMLAWILNTKAVMAPSSASTRRVSAACARGAGA